jgi:hypothetical protein
MQDVALTVIGMDAVDREEFRHRWQRATVHRPTHDAGIAQSYSRAVAHVFR